MAYEAILQNVTLESDTDLSASQYRLMSVTTAGRVLRVATRGAAAIGVLQEKTTETGQSQKIAVYGVSKVAAGDSSGMENAINYGTPLIASSVGRAVPTTLNIGDRVIGLALGSLSTGATGIIPMLITHQGMSSS